MHTIAENEREGDGNDFPYLRPSFANDSQNAVHELGRLAGPRSRFDDHRFVDRVPDDAPGIVIGMSHHHTHGLLRSA